jgi:hypothetical protein
MDCGIGRRTRRLTTCTGSTTVVRASAYALNHLGRQTVAEVGSNGACGDEPGKHSTGEAFDLSRVRFSRGTVIDCNCSWQHTPSGKRRYLGLLAACRLQFGLVLGAGYNSDHNNHIYGDNTFSIPQLVRTTSRSDTCIVQQACAWLNGSTISIDGVWGSGTESAYQSLLTSMRVQCKNPKTNWWDMVEFFDLIAKDGFSGQSASFYRGTC